MAPAKTQLLIHEGAEPGLGEDLYGTWQAQPRKDGIVLCGNPLAQGDQPDSAIPMGTNEFCRGFLSQREHRTQADLARLEELVATAPDGEGMLEAAWFLARDSLSKTQIHLWRTLPFTLTRESAQRG